MKFNLQLVLVSVVFWAVLLAVSIPLAACPLEERLKEAGLVDAAVAIQDLQVDLVYATPNNMFGKPMYACLKRAYLKPETVRKLTRAQELLKKRHPRYTLKILDAARPRSVQKKMWAMVVNTPLQPYVANPATGSMHNFGAAVDITIVDGEGRELDMGEPSPRDRIVGRTPVELERLLQQIKVTDLQQQNRTLLADVMTGAGFTGFSLEWWHFRAFEKDHVRSHFTIIE